jgi:hypothetical protein
VANRLRGEIDGKYTVVMEKESLWMSRQMGGKR